MSIKAVFCLSTIFFYKQRTLADSVGNFSGCFPAYPVNIISCISVRDNPFTITARVCDGIDDCLDGTDESVKYCGTGCTSVYKSDTKVINCGRKLIDVIHAININEKSETSVDSGVNVTQCFTRCNGQHRCKLFLTEEKFNYVLLSFQCLGSMPNSFIPNHNTKEYSGPPCNYPITPPPVFHTIFTPTTSEPSWQHTTVNLTLYSADIGKQSVGTIVGVLVVVVLVISLITFVLVFKFRRNWLKCKTVKETESTDHYPTVSFRPDTGYSSEYNKLETTTKRQSENLNICNSSSNRYKERTSENNLDNERFKNNGELSANICDKAERFETVSKQHLNRREVNINSSSNNYCHKNDAIGRGNKSYNQTGSDVIRRNDIYEETGSDVIGRDYDIYEETSSDVIGLVDNSNETGSDVIGRGNDIYEETSSDVIGLVDNSNETGSDVIGRSNDINEETSSDVIGRGNEKNNKIGSDVIGQGKDFNEETGSDVIRRGNDFNEEPGSDVIGRSDVIKEESGSDVIDQDNDNTETGSKAIGNRSR